MEYLLELGISKNLVNFLSSSSDFEDLRTDSDNVQSSIEYLLSLGVDIKTIEDMLFNDYTIFMGGKSSLEKLLGNVDKEKLVYYLNNNFIDI